jgi:hypothetical protein
VVEAVARALEAEGVPVATGRFGAMMDVELVNDGPVTLVLDSDDPRQRGRKHSRTEDRDAVVVVIPGREAMPGAIEDSAAHVITAVAIFIPISIGGHSHGCGCSTQLHHLSALETREVRAESGIRRRRRHRRIRHLVQQPAQAVRVQRPEPL